MTPCSSAYTLCSLSDMQKDVGLNIRIDSQLRDRFIAICREQDRPAAQVIREFMRAYVAEHEAANDSETAHPRKQGDGHGKA